MATWNSSEQAVVTLGRIRIVYCRPHSGRYGYGHTLEAIATSALAARRLGAALCFVPTGTEVDDLTRLDSRQIRIVSFGALPALAWRLRRASVAVMRGAAGPSALLWRLAVAAHEAAADRRWSKRVRKLLKRGAGLLRDGAPSILARGKRAVRNTSVGSRPWLIAADWHELADVPLDLRLSAAATIAAEQRARAAGIAVEARIVAIHVRPPGYKATLHLKERAVDAVRGADITTYVPAITRLTRAGYVVVRIGDPSMPAIELPGVVDLAHSPQRCKLLDIWVVLNSRFMVICDSGPSLLARLGPVPCLGVNIVDLKTGAVKPNDRFICKRVVGADGEPLSLPAMFRAGVLGASEAPPARQDSAARVRTNAEVYRYCDNSADEIADAVDDMLDVVTNTPMPDPAQLWLREMLVQAAGAGFVGRGHVSAPFARRWLEHAA